MYTQFVYIPHFFSRTHSYAGITCAGCWMVFLLGSHLKHGDTIVVTVLAIKKNDWNYL